MDSVLELNCAGLQHVCLSGFEVLKHRAILWDECPAKLVCDNRKVFQHPQCMVDLGHSPTGQHIARYFLGNCCSIITTNSWHEEMAGLTATEQEWLMSNMVVFGVTQKLWLAPAFH